MKNLVVNIGLNVGNEEPTNQLKTTMDILSHMFDFTSKDFRIHEGQWQTDEGVVEERVLVVELNVGNLTVVSVKPLLESICEGLVQEAIAYRLNGVGHMAFNDEYEGERFEFKDEFFRTI